MNLYKTLVRLNVGGDSPCAHMSLVAQNGIAYIVKVRNLNLIKQQSVFQLTGVAYNSLFTNDHVAS